jgi:chemotaxis protein histidine kinase CheA
MSDSDFDADEMALLRRLFVDEAKDAIETITALTLPARSTAPGPDDLIEMMRLTHSIKGAAGTIGLSALVDIAHRFESALARLRSGAVAWTPAVQDHIIQFADQLRALVDLDPDSARYQAQAEQLVAHLAGGHRRDDAPVVPPTGSTAVPEHSEAGAEDRSENVELSTAIPDRGGMLRVEASRIDELMSSAGEILFDRTRIERRVQFLRTLTRDLTQSRQSLRDQADQISDERSRNAVLQLETELAGLTTQLSQSSAALIDEVEALRRTIAELQRGLTRIRMQTARSLFLHIARATRALSRTTGVEVVLHTEGEDTEFDKSVAEQIVDPLIQLLRNAIVHGIEPVAQRRAAGKGEVGAVYLRARQDGAGLVLELGDDGRGIDPVALRRQHVAAGRWSAEQARLATDDDALRVLFEPGVSGRDNADELAGRGIGLDLVRETVSRLGGEIELTTAVGTGTTFRLRLPLSTSVIHAMLFKLGGQVYALPKAHVVDLLVVERDATSVRHQDRDLPVLRLDQLLGVSGNDAARGPGLAVEYAGKRLACTVDKIVGPREIVLRPLGPLLAHLPLYAGATISASGKVQLILDTAQLVRRIYPEAAGAHANEPAASAVADLAGRALVVDDSRAIREAMSAMLAREGWIVDVAEDGARAWHMANHVRYDLVVTDLEMPALSGFDLISRLRATPALATIAVLVITSRGSPENRRRARDLGVRALVNKPITRRKLLEALAAR